MRLLKLIGLLLGARLFGLPGGLIGFWLGFILDDAWRSYRSPLRKSVPMGVQQAFFEATFLLMGYMAKVDGPVQVAEIRAAEAAMARFASDDQVKREAVRLFREGKAFDFDPLPILTRFYDEAAFDETLRHAFVEMQLILALSDGPLHPAERALLLDLCERLEIWPGRFAALGAGRAQARQSTYHDKPLAEAYRVLGLSSSVSDAELKQHYRRLMNQHHPDKIFARGLPASHLSAAKERTQAIRAAYDQIREQRAAQ